MFTVLHVVEGKLESLSSSHMLSIPNTNVEQFILMKHVTDSNSHSLNPSVIKEQAFKHISKFSRDQSGIIH